jgi:DNA-binding GntR family transcriptional regulator
VRLRGDIKIVLMLNPDLPVPLWQQLVTELRARIDSGEWTARVPSIKTLAQEYETSHRTVETALTALKDQGVIVAVVGRGYFVATD